MSFVVFRLRIWAVAQISPTRYLTGVQQLDAVMLKDQCL